MPAIVKIKTSQQHALNIPTDAVIRERNGASVWLKTGEYSFRSQMVHNGIEGNGAVEILHGLKKRDVVVVNGAYLLNSEFVFKRGTNAMAAHTY